MIGAFFSNRNYDKKRRIIVNKIRLSLRSETKIITFIFKNV